MMNKKKQPFFSKIADKVKRFGKKYGLPAVFAISGIFGGSTKAYGAPAEKALADSLATEIMNTRMSVPNDAELEAYCKDAVFSAQGQGLYWQAVDEMLSSVGENMSEYAAEIQEQMQGKNRRKKLNVLNEYLGKNTLGSIGKTTVQNAPSATCSWAGNRLIFLSAQSSGAEDFFDPYAMLLDNVNYASAGFGNTKTLKKNNIYNQLLHTSANTKNLKKSLEEDIKNNPTDIFLVAEYSSRARSKHHIITVVGDEYFSFNRERIGDSHKRVQKMRQRYYINVSEFIRRNINEEKELTDLSKSTLKELKSILTQAKREGFFVRKLSAYAPISCENAFYSDLSAKLTLNGMLGGETGGKIIQNWQLDVKNNTQSVLAQALASDQISDERKEELRLAHKGFADSDLIASNNHMTEEEALVKLYEFNIRASSKVLKQIRKEKSLTSDQKILCAHAVTHTLEQGGFLQKEDAQEIMATLTQGKNGNVEYSVTAQGDTLQLNWEQTSVNEKKVTLEKKKLTYRTARKAASMTRKRLQENLKRATASSQTVKKVSLKGTYKPHVKSSSQNTPV